jgi:hypothetical protein
MKTIEIFVCGKCEREVHGIICGGCKLKHCNAHERFYGPPESAWRPLSEFSSGGSSHIGRQGGLMCHCKRCHSILAKLNREMKKLRAK